LIGVPMINLGSNNYSVYDFFLNDFFRKNTQEQERTMSLKPSRLATALSLSVALASFAGGVAAASLEDIKQRGHIRIAVANEIPYGYVDMNGEAKGAGPDVAREVMKQLGIDKIEWITTSFSSLIPGLRA